MRTCTRLYAYTAESRSESISKRHAPFMCTTGVGINLIAWLPSTKLIIRALKALIMMPLFSHLSLMIKRAQKPLPFVSTSKAREKSGTRSIGHGSDHNKVLL